MQRRLTACGVFLHSFSPGPRGKPTPCPRPSHNSLPHSDKAGFPWPSSGEPYLTLPLSTQWGTQLLIPFPPATYQEAEWHWLLFKSHSCRARLSPNLSPSSSQLDDFKHLASLSLSFLSVKWNSWVAWMNWWMESTPWTWDTHWFLHVIPLGSMMTRRAGPLLQR